MVNAHNARGKRRWVHALESSHDVGSSVGRMKKRTPSSGLRIPAHTVGLADGISTFLQIVIGRITTYVRIWTTAVHIPEIQGKGISLSGVNDLGFDDLIDDRPAADPFLRKVSWFIRKVRAGERKRAGEESENGKKFLHFKEI